MTDTTPAEMREQAKQTREGLDATRVWSESDLRAGADALDRLADVIEYTDLTGVPEAQNHTSKGAQAVKRRVHRIAHGDTTNHEVGSQS